MLHVVTRDAATRSHVTHMQDIILDELNVKQLEVGEHEGALASLSAKADFKVLGPKLGPKVKQAAALITKLSSETIEAVIEGSAHVLELGDGESVALSAEDLVVERVPLAGTVVASEGEIVVGLDTDLSDSLVAEGLAREFVNKVQNMRKTAEFDVSQRIETRYACGPELANAVEAFADYIKAETLSVAAAPADLDAEAATAWDVNGFECLITVSPVEAAGSGSPS